MNNNQDKQAIKFGGESGVLKEELRLLNKEKNEQIGLAFSGGGIRSATLCLGVLQGLAKHKLLAQIDYLSTVSGGGYIGAWFSALIHHRVRNHNINAEQALLAVQAELAASTLSRNLEDVPSQTDKAIQWLRSYSNYLTPKTGLFTADTRAAFAQWFSNTFLNQLLLAALLLCIFIATNVLANNEFNQLLGYFSANKDNSNLSTSWVEQGFGIMKRDFLLLIPIFYIIASSIWPKVSFLRHIRSAYSIAFAYLIFRFIAAPNTTLESELKNDSLSITAYLDSICKYANTESNYPDIWIGLGLPAFLICASIVFNILIGVAGRAANSHYREWWYRLGGMNTSVSVIWFAAFACAVYIPWFVIKNYSQHLAAISSFGVASYLTSFAVAKFGKSTISSEGKNAFLEKLTPLLPYLAITLIMLCIGFCSYLIYISNYTKYWFFALFFIVAVGNWRFDINIFSLHNFYRNRLTRCYLGASNKAREQHVDSFTGFANTDDIPLAELEGQIPIPIINTALNISDGSELAIQQSKAASFFFTPKYSGFSFKSSGNKPSSGFIKTSEYVYPNIKGPFIGSLIATSGAAASPNMGYHTNAGLGFIMTIFNARLGRWFGNPNAKNTINIFLEKLGSKLTFKDPAQRTSPYWNIGYLLAELFTKTSANSDYFYLSDGGHFENLGIYELVRRECRLIIAIDAEEDGKYQFEGLGNAIRKCKVDFGVDIDIPLKDIYPTEHSQCGNFKVSKKQFAIGRIDYAGNKTGVLIYAKSSLIKGLPTDLINFKLAEPAFPHHSTIDQFFNESQFESYRLLGELIAEKMAKDIKKYT